MSSSHPSPSFEPVPDAKHQDLEIKDAQLIFNSVFHQLQLEFGRENLSFPKELILLGGAPGAGKGTNTDFVLKQRGITAPAIVVSSLLDSDAARKIKDAGGMVGDREVVGLLLRRLLDPIFQNGALLDGFPRTKVQVECLKLLHEKMVELKREFARTPRALNFRRPTFHIVMLFVEEREAINRQLKRGREIHAHNIEVRQSGVGELLEERNTDLSEEAARKRYQVFKEKTFDALQSLREVYHYHFINAHGTVEEVQQLILDEFTYQSALELNPETFEAIRDIPLTSELTMHARQDLVRRLDGYANSTPELLARVVDFIQQQMMPIVTRHTISGQANINTEDMLLAEPGAIAILLDVLSDRGFHSVVDIHHIEIPSHFDLTTGAITCRKKTVYRLIVRFKASDPSRLRPLSTSLCIPKSDTQSSWQRPQAASSSSSRLAPMSPDKASKPPRSQAPSTTGCPRRPA